MTSTPTPDNKHNRYLFKLYVFLNKEASLSHSHWHTHVYRDIYLGVKIHRLRAVLEALNHKGKEVPQEKVCEGTN